MKSENQTLKKIIENLNQRNEEIRIKKLPTAEQIVEEINDNAHTGGMCVDAYCK